MHGWDTGLSLGQVLDQQIISNILSEQIREETNPKMFQVSAVDVNQDGDPVVFHRGPVVWNGKSFDSKNKLVAWKEKPIQVPALSSHICIESNHTG